MNVIPDSARVQTFSQPSKNYRSNKTRTQSALTPLKLVREQRLYKMSYTL